VLTAPAQHSKIGKGCHVFRRRSRQDAHPAEHGLPTAAGGPGEAAAGGWDGDAGDDADGDDYQAAGGWDGDEGYQASGAGPPAVRPVATTGGPWDAGDSVPEAERIDLGSLRVPAGEGLEVQLTMAEDQPASITVVHGDSGLQLQAFAAPKSGGLWDEVREEIAAEIAKAGGQSQEAAGPFGVELQARIAAEQGVRGAGLEPVRFLGVDGPRWFLRGVISGPAARREQLAGPLERVFAGVVVVRGDHPVPPRDLLEIRLPPEAQEALEAQLEDAAGGRWALSPFERGPEITETR
jgi:Protein of unknown function (DUF3710)